MHWIMKKGWVVMNYARRVFFIFLLIGFGNISHAAIVSYSTVFTISSSNFSDINVGDQFQFLFSIDDSVLDTNNSESNRIGYIDRSGQFLNALTSATLTALSGNVGSYDPTSTDFSPNITTSDQTSVGIIGSSVVDTVIFAIDLPIFGSSAITITQLFLNDLGIGQSFAEVSRGGLDQSPVSVNIDFFRLTFESGVERARGSASSITVVPIPAAFWLFSSAFGVLLLSSRNLRKQK